MNIGLILILGVMGSFAFLTYAIYSYLQDDSNDKVIRPAQKETESLNSQEWVEPYIEVDTTSNTAVLTLENGMKKTLSSIDMARHQRGITAKQLNDDYMLKQT
jgi:hypothetical protein